MNDPENFLSRWSRRKRTAEEEREPAEPESLESVAKDHSPAVTQENSAAVESGDEKDEKKEKAGEPAFDLSKLPSLESITAETDIRAFLAPGVPTELTRAALRRVWVIDPKIRDFIEIAENQWDFTAPGVPGFDLSPPTGDIKQMLAQILPKSMGGESDAKGEGNDREVPPTSAVEHSSHRNVKEAADEADESHKAEQERIAQHAPAVSDDNQDSENAAPQKVSALQDERPTPKRGHGGAMPR
jgi:Protein of unknown function (DUF3306)